MHSKLSRELAASFANIALAHVTREYPGKMDHILTGPADIASPRAFHPAFYGSFDWHSCVHGFWLLAKILRVFPDLPQAVKIRSLFDDHLTPDKIAGELSYLERPSQENFERPYGWAWLLMLAGELAQHTTADAKIWHAHLQPLALLFAGRFRRYLSKLPFPIRAGTHPNTAFAAVLAIEYAEVCGEVDLLTLVRTRMREFFASDVNCQALEPNGNDFHSPLPVMVVHPSVSAKTIPEFISYAKANPGKIVMASVGNGTTPQMTGELFKMMTGVDLLHVPYQGAAPALTDLLAGRAHVMFEAMPTLVGYIQSGKLRALGVSTATRSTVFPNIPTIREFVPGYEFQRLVRHCGAQTDASRDRGTAQQRD